MIFVDSKRYGNGNTSTLKKMLSFPGARFMCLYRIINKLGRKNILSPLFKILYKRLQVKYGFQIPHTCRIGDGLFLGHFGNIVINQNAVIGSNCNIAQGVTIGNVSRGPKKGCPMIGDRVWIGANAVIVGQIFIGDDALIAPLTFVNFDVPQRAVVAGNPAKVLNYTGSVGYVKNLV